MSAKKAISICNQCGEKGAVNTCGVCVNCWTKYKSLRKNPEAKW